MIVWPTSMRSSGRERRIERLPPRQRFQSSLVRRLLTAYGQWLDG